MHRAFLMSNNDKPEKQIKETQANLKTLMTLMLSEVLAKELLGLSTWLKTNKKVYYITFR
jgi:hypothetical protein